VVGFTHRPLYPREKSPGTHWKGGWVGPRNGLDDVERWKTLPLPGLELQPLGRPARRQSLYRLHYSDDDSTSLRSLNEFTERKSFWELLQQSGVLHSGVRSTESEYFSRRWQSISWSRNGSYFREPESSLPPVGTIPSQTNPIHTLAPYNRDRGHMNRHLKVTELCSFQTVSWPTRCNVGFLIKF
jgi:hypothetical protein